MIDSFHQDLTKTDLGKKIGYSSVYDPSLLRPISRSSTRNHLGIKDPLIFYGVDIWTDYDFSCLNSKGKPQIAIMELRFPYDSNFLLESKSLKLYLNSFCQKRFENMDELNTTLQQDLKKATEGPVLINLNLPENFSKLNLQEFDGYCLDNLPIEVDCYQYQPEFLITENFLTEEKIFTHLFRSNCPVTHQPDWASIWIHYIGNKISHENLLKYLISFRQTYEFGEQCVERIFMDIMDFCRPTNLSILMRSTRRGGLDINPFRTNFAKEMPENIRLHRQ